MPVRTTVEPLERHKVKLHVEVDASTFETAVDQAFRKLSAEVRIPGFRKGKVPRKLLEARLGPELVREEALKEALPAYFAEALKVESIDAVSPPEIDNVSAEAGADVSFDAVVEVRPKVELGDWKSLTVTIPSPEATDEEVDAQIGRLREQFAELEPVGRPANEGDFVNIDIKGYVHTEEVPGTSASDLLYRVGSGTIVPQLDKELQGKRAGDILKFNDRLPEAFGDDAGKEVAFQVLVKEVSARRLPEVTDDWVQEVSEFETAGALRADVAQRLSMVKRVETLLAARDRVLDALVERVAEEPPDSMIGHEMEHLLERFLTRLREQNVGLRQYLEAIGQTEEGFIEQMRDRATKAVKADLALRAIAEAEGLAASPEEVDAEVSAIAERTGKKPAEIRKNLEKSGAFELLGSDIVKRAALEFAVRTVEIRGEDGGVVDLDDLARRDAATGDTTDPEEGQ